jgi:flagellar motility protein MotE (MotC chaperone)
MKKSFALVVAAGLLVLMPGRTGHGAEPVAVPKAPRIVGAEVITPVVPRPQEEAAAAPAAGAGASNAALYCKNIANQAADARYARQVAALNALEKQIDERIARLEAKRAELEEWVRRREELLKKADDSVVAIYSQMRPDAAAQQIAAMDPEAAAAILSKVTPRTASAILNEMDVVIAAALTNLMAGLKSEDGDQG